QFVLSQIVSSTLRILSEESRLIRSKSPFHRNAAPALALRAIWCLDRSTVELHARVPGRELSSIYLPFGTIGTVPRDSETCVRKTAHNNTPKGVCVVCSAFLRRSYAVFTQVFAHRLLHRSSSWLSASLTSTSPNLGCLLPYIPICSLRITPSASAARIASSSS